MTTEDEFQAALDRDPRNHLLRRVFADWLDERDDSRGPGYRALGVNGFYTQPHNLLETWFDVARFDLPQASWFLPNDWFRLLEGGKELWTPDMPAPYRAFPVWQDYHSRREADDAAALAFAKLPPGRQAELLNLTPVSA